MAPQWAGAQSRHRWWILLVLSGLLAITLTHTWARWGELRIDAGGAIDRAARVAQGELLYRDVLSPYGPLGTYTMAAVFRVFGIHLSCVYALCVVVVALQGWMLWLLGRRVMSEWEAAFGVVMFWALMAIQPGLTSWILPNTFASLLGAFFATTALTFALASHDDRAQGSLACASLAAALAGLAKIEFGVAAVGGSLVAILVTPRPGGRSWRAIVAVLAPGALLTLLVAGVLLALVPVDQLIGENLYRQRTLAVVVAATRGWAEFPWWPAVWEAISRYGMELPVRAALLAAGASAALGSRGARRWFGLALAVAALLPPFLPGYPQLREFLGLRRGLPYYWAPAAWGTVVVVAAVAHLRSPSPRTRAAVVLSLFSLLLALRWNFRMRLPSYYGFLGPILLLLVVRTVASVLLRRAVPPWAVIAVFVVPLVSAESVNLRTFRERSTALQYPRGTIADTPARARPVQQVVDLIRSSTVATDYVAVLPEERIINFLSERRNPTRDSGIGPGWLATAQDEAAYIDELRASAPAMVVVSRRRYPEFGVGDLASYNPLVAQHLEREYRLLRTVGPGRNSYAVYVPHHSPLRR